MELKNYEYIDVTEYLRDKYPEDFDEAVSEVTFFEDTVTDLRNRAGILGDLSPRWKLVFVFGVITICIYKTSI